MPALTSGRLAAATLAAVLTTRLNPPLTVELAGRLAEIWVAVTDAGGAVGLVAPASLERARALAGATLERVVAGDEDLVVGYDGGEVVAFGFLAWTSGEIAPHRSEVRRLQRHPRCAARGVGAAVLAALEQRSLERHRPLVTLTVRGGTGTEGWYLRHGYQIVGVLPGFLEIAGERRASIVLAKDLSGAGIGLRLPVRRLDPDLPLPAYVHRGDAGLDLHARTDLVLQPGERAVMPTGVAVAIPEGFVGLIHPRSGLAVSAGLSIVNSPGTIDAGYRGELKVPLINHDPAAPVEVHRGDRIAQLLVQRVEQVHLVEVDELPRGTRGGFGFGSSGR